jgi:hypothetical protein
VDLPPLFALWRYERSLDVNRYDAVLVMTTKILSARCVWSLSLVENPLDHIQNASLVHNSVDRWFSNRAHHIIIQRQSTINEENNRYHDVFIQYKNYVIQLEENQVIPILFMSEVYSAMPIQFVNLHLPENMKYRFQLKRGPVLPVVEAPTVEAPTVEAPTIETRLPQFVINELIEGIVARNLDCPILIERLTRESTRILPCCHAISAEAVLHYSDGIHSCPQCRKPFRNLQLQQWK